MRPHADRAPTLAVQWNDRLGRDLPGVRDICQSGVHCGCGFFSARRIECKLDERDDLMQRLIFGKLAGRKAAGEIVRAVLDRESPVHDVDIAGRHQAKLAGGSRPKFVEVAAIGCSSVAAPVMANGPTQ